MRARGQVVDTWPLAFVIGTTSHFRLDHLGAESGKIALPRNATLDWFHYLLKRNNNYHATTLPRFLLR